MHFPYGPDNEEEGFSPDTENGNKIIMDSFSQYFKLVDGWLPTTKTVKKLDSGIYNISWDTSRSNLLYIPQKLNIDNLIEFPDSLSSNILKEIEIFWDKKELFKKSGLVYKRGILLYGIPGTGKTTTINFVIKKILDRDGIVFTNGSSIKHFIYMLQKFRSIEPDRPILVVFEDVDKQFKTGEDEDSISNFLNLLDGNIQINNIIFMATTNSPEILDKNIVNRPSRFDLVLKVPLPDSNQRRIYFKSFNLLSNLELEEWSKDSEGLTISHLKELIISVKLFNYNYKTILDRLIKMGIQPKQSSLPQIGLNV